MQVQVFATRIGFGFLLLCCLGLGCSVWTVEQLQHTRSAAPQPAEVQQAARMLYDGVDRLSDIVRTYSITHDPAYVRAYERDWQLSAAQRQAFLDMLERQLQAADRELTAVVRRRLDTLGALAQVAMALGAQGNHDELSLLAQGPAFEVAVSTSQEAVLQLQAKIEDELLLQAESDQAHAFAGAITALSAQLATLVLLAFLLPRVMRLQARPR